MEKQKSTLMETKALERVQDHEKQKWYSIAFIWIGAIICVPMLMVGAILGTNFSIGMSILVCAIGFGVCAGIMSLTGMIGSDQGLPSAMLATKSFGDTGARVIVSLIIAVVQIGWYAVQAATCGAAFCGMMTVLGINFPLWLAVIIWGIVMAITAVYGFNLLKILNYIAVPALFAVCIWGVILALTTGQEAVKSFTPTGQMPFMSAVSMMMGLFAMGTVICSDFSRYAKSRVDTIKSSFLGVLPAAILMTIVGAVMSIAAQEPTGDITMVFAKFGPFFSFVGMLTLILATWTTNTSNAYTAGLAVMKMFNLAEGKRPIVTAICAAIGTVLGAVISYSLIGTFSSFVSILAGIIPPVAGVLIADYWIVEKGDKSKFRTIPGCNWRGIIAWAVAAVFGVLFAIGKAKSIINPAIDAILIAMIGYVVLSFIIKDKQKQK